MNEKFIITKLGHKGRVYWMETQESPVLGSWKMNIKKATVFSSEKKAERYIKKYLSDFIFEFAKPEIIKKDSRKQHGIEFAVYKVMEKIII
jgi:hypothetical protein